MIKEKLTLKVVLPEGILCQTECDRITLCIAEDKNGKGSGSYGIHKGHAKALLSLSKGRLEAFDGPQNVFSKQIGGGFASVENDLVTVVADSVS